MTRSFTWTRDADTPAYPLAVAFMLAGIVIAGLLGINATANWSLGSLSGPRQIRPLTFLGPQDSLNRPVRVRQPARTEAPPVRVSQLPRSFVPTSIQTDQTVAPLSTFASPVAPAPLKVRGASTDHKVKGSKKAEAHAAHKPGGGEHDNGPKSSLSKSKGRAA